MRPQAKVRGLLQFRGSDAQALSSKRALSRLPGVRPCVGEEIIDPAERVELAPCRKHPVAEVGPPSYERDIGLQSARKGC